MLPLSVEAKNHTREQKYAIYVIKNSNTKKLHKIRDHCDILPKQVAVLLVILQLRKLVFQVILVLMNNGSKCYYMIIRQVTFDFKSNIFHGLGQNTEKYISFSVLIDNNKNE